MMRVENETRNHIKDVLNELMGEQGVTGFAKSVGVKRDDVNNWLNGKADIRPAALIAISKKYNVSIDYLLGLSETKSLDPSYASTEALTGLNAEAITCLKEINDSICKPASHVKAELLSCIIKSPGFTDLIKTMTELAILAADIEQDVNCGRGFSEDGTAMSINVETLDSMTLALKYGRYAGADSFSRILDSILDTPADYVVGYAEDFIRGVE